MEISMVVTKDFICAGKASGRCLQTRVSVWTYPREDAIGKQLMEVEENVISLINSH